MNIAVFCSGNGSNFQAIVDAAKEGLFKAKIALMICDNPEAYAIRRARKEGIRTFLVERNNFSSKKAFEEKILGVLKKEKIGLICLAGFMRILSPEFIAKYRGRIINIHPALLPSFKGAHAIKDALSYGAKTTGVTVHFVNEDVDAGPIIMQEALEIKRTDTEKTLAERIHKLEHRLYPEAIKLFTERKLKIVGRRVKILSIAAILFLALGFETEAMLGNDIICTTSLNAKIVSTEALLKQDLHLPKPPTSVAVKKIKRNKIYDARLSIFGDRLYGIEELTPQDIKTMNLLNSIRIEKPLTKEEINRMRIENSVKTAKVVANAFEYINAKPISDGISELTDTAKKVIDFRNYVGEKYNLHLRVDSDEALLRYQKRF